MPVDVTSPVGDFYRLIPQPAFQVLCPGLTPPLGGPGHAPQLSPAFRACLVSQSQPYTGFFLCALHAYKEAEGLSLQHCRLSHTVGV